MLDKLYVLSRQYLTTKYRDYHRSLLQEACFKHRLSILIGQRGVGKTTIIVQYILDQVNKDELSKEILYVPTDHFLLSDTSLYEIAEQFTQLGGKIIAFDEIHKYEEWSRELKSIYDTFPDLQIIASGSSALEIHKGSHDLTRRAIVYNVTGFSLREYLELTLNESFPIYKLNEILTKHEQYAHDILTIITKNNRKILSLFNEYLQIGYYPYSSEVKDKDKDNFFMALNQNFHTIIESDLMAIYPSLAGNSIRKVKQLLAFIAATVPFTPHWLKIKNLIEVGDERTLKTYFKYLEDAELIRMVMKGTKKMHKIETPEKIYLNNTNQLYAISAEAQNIGTIRETFFLSALSFIHNVGIPNSGDFIVNDETIFEVGGKNKDFKQIHDQANGYLVCDGLEVGIGKKIPLWLFGFLY